MVTLWSRWKEKDIIKTNDKERLGRKITVENYGGILWGIKELGLLIFIFSSITFVHG